MPVLTRKVVVVAVVLLGVNVSVGGARNEQAVQWVGGVA